jgi:hypothetical protein
MSFKVKTSPRTFETLTVRPNKLRAAVAPNATTRAGFTISRSRSFHQRQCFTALVTNTALRSMPASVMARSSTRPAGQTKGLPATGEVFLIARLFADHHQPGADRAFSRHHLGGIAKELTARTGSLCLFQSL